MKGADMQEAFEKIIEKLNEKARFYNSASDVDQNIRSGVIIAKEVVQEEAAEYKGGWIPCSERLPEEYTVLCCDKYGEMIIGNPYFDEVSDTNYSAESDNEMMYNCVAWQQLPEPYKK